MIDIIGNSFFFVQAHKLSEDFDEIVDLEDAMCLITRCLQAKTPIQLSSLHLGKKLCLLHLPAESFVEFQLYAQEQRPDGFVATAAYGDGGPWYIPLAKAYQEGGYEPSVSFVDPEAEALLKDDIRQLVRSA
jgi:hypothetical protein